MYFIDTLPEYIDRSNLPTMRLRAKIDPDPIPSETAQFKYIQLEGYSELDECLSQFLANVEVDLLFPEDAVESLYVLHTETNYCLCHLLEEAYREAYPEHENVPVLHRKES